MTQRLDRLPAGLVLGAMLLTAAVLIGLYDKTLINPDTIQLVDAARHLLAGDGFSTSIILYESQLQFGHVPAPLTVWPPGLSWLLLLPMKLGLSGEAAAFALCVIGQLATTWLIFILARRFAGPRIAAVAAIAWLLHSIALMMVLAMYAEPIFIAFTVASYFALIEAGKDRGWDRGWSTRWLLIAGAAAAWAILMRYSGVLWPAAAGLWLLWMAVRGRSWQPIRAAFIFGALPALTTAALFLRNLLLTGRFSGGQFEYGGPGGFIVVARHLLWDSNMILGRLLRLSPIVFALVVGTLIVAIILAGRRSRTSEPRDAAVGLAISSTLVLVAFLVGNAIQSSLVFVDYRYWLPAVPFLAVLLSVVTHDAIVAVPKHSFLPQRMWPAAVVASCALLTISVLAALPERWPIRTAHPTVAVIEQALAQRMPDGRTVREAVTTGDLNKPLLAHLEQRFYAQTGRAVVGLINATYSKRVWTKHEVKELVEQYGIEQVVLFPQAFQPNLVENKNQQFWNELLGGQLPPWLKAHYVSANVVLYDVVPAELRETE
jgi:4-amino-4-deoxy-L-arabinose transferase-like glycosyltransferase